MANPYFQFKQFTIWHDKCAMKVGTDGALLGAWTDIRQSTHVLDIGTGTGLIALMLAQRSAAAIDAIDIDADACLQAKENIMASPFAGRIAVHHIPLAEYALAHGSKYDLIVSNPPYFVDSLKCPNQKRNTARHTDTLSLPDLLRDCRKLLSPSGRIALVLPYDQRESTLNIASEHALYLSKETWVAHTHNKPPKRWLVELSINEIATPLLSRLSLKTESHGYTEEFSALVKNFYLKI